LHIPEVSFPFPEISSLVRAPAFLSFAKNHSNLRLARLQARCRVRVVGWSRPFQEVSQPHSLFALRKHMAPRVRGRGAGRQGNPDRAESSRAHEEDPRALLMSPRRVLPPRYIDFTDISPYVSQLEELFGAQGWVGFVSAYRRYYPQLVQQFYSNLVIENDRLYSMVKGVRITVTTSTLANALRMNWEGMTPTHGEFDHGEVYSAMTERALPDYDVDLIILDATTFPHCKG
jgi:hypothetical protein